MKSLKILFKSIVILLSIVGTLILAILLPFFATPVIWFILLAPLVWIFFEFCFILMGHLFEGVLSDIGIYFPLVSFFKYLGRTIPIVFYLSILGMILYFAYQIFETSWKKNKMQLLNLLQELRKELKTLNSLLNFLNNQKLKIITYWKKIEAKERKRNELKKKLKELKKKQKEIEKKK